MIGSALKKGIGGVGGAILGGAGLIGAGLISSAGAGKYVAGAAAIGASAKTGANWLGNKSFGGSGSSGGKEDTTEELSKVSSIGMLSVEKLDAIYNNVLDLRKFFAGQDPESQEREKALDEKTKNKQLIAAIRGISTGKGGGKMPEKLKTGFLELLKDLLAISAIAALFANLDKVQEFLDKLPSWAGKISEAIDSIMEFVNDLDSFFENLGIEFGGAAGRGITRGITRATKNYSRRSGPDRSQIKKNNENRKARNAEAERLRKIRENFAKQKLKQDRILKDSKASQKKKDKAKAQREKLNKQMEVERDKLRERRAKNAAIKEKARLNAERRAARNQRLKSAAGKLFNIAEVKPTGQGPNTTKGKFPKTDYKPRGRGGMASGIGNYLITLLKGKGRPMGSKQTPYGKGYDKIWNKKPKTTVAKTADAIKKMFRPDTVKPPAGQGGMGTGYGEGYDRIFNKKPTTPGPIKRGGVARGLAALTPIVKKMFRPDTVKPPAGQGGMAVEPVQNIKTREALERRSRPTAPVKPTTSVSKLEASLKNIKNIPADIIKDWQTQGELDKSGGWEKLKSVDKFLGQQPWVGRILKTVGWVWFGVLAAMELYSLASNWLKNRTPGDFNPFDGSSDADNNFKMGFAQMVGAYGGGYLGAIAGGMLGTMLPLPFIGTIAGSITGGLLGSILGSNVANKLYGDKQAEKFELFAKNSSDIKNVDNQISVLSSALSGNIESGNAKPNPIEAANIRSQLNALEIEKIKLISERGALEQDMIIVADNTIIAPTSQVDSSVVSTNVYVDNNTAVQAGMGPNPHKY